MSCSGGGGQSELPWPADQLHSLAIRTDFGDDDAWARVRTVLETQVSVSANGRVVGEFRPSLHPRPPRPR
ncbi:MAG TPA: hypothetical protein VNB06_21870 [Thermoanaerobaculia bacterium]|nr:hypothetical protein [Thermoanaerobaculia bacterium]